jgi:hypothetical protein
VRPGHRGSRDAGRRRRLPAPARAVLLVAALAAACLAAEPAEAQNVVRRIDQALIAGANDIRSLVRGFAILVAVVLFALMIFLRKNPAVLGGLVFLLIGTVGVAFAPGIVDQSLEWVGAFSPAVAVDPMAR